MRSVEPEPDSAFATDRDASAAPLDDGLRTELQFVLGMDAEGVTEWVDRHGAAAARERVWSYWVGER